MAIANSTEDGNHTITKSSVALQFLEQLRTFSFQLWIFHYPSLHLLGIFWSLLLFRRFRRFIRRRNICSVVWPHTHPLRGGIHLSRDHSNDWYYFWFLFIITTLLFSGVSLLTMTAIRVDRLLAPFFGLRYRQVVTVRRVMALVDTLWYPVVISLMA